MEKKSNSQKVFIICGLPGAGKTTLAKKLLSEGRIHDFFEADMWMINQRGEYSFKPSKLKFCHQSCFNAFYDSLSEGKSVAVSNTNLEKWEAERYILCAKLAGAEIEIIHIPNEVNYGSVHGVPEDKVEKMRERREFFTLEDFKNLF